ncbi:hypothetical protein PAHAL_1G099000 [Panicum hallii]|uniref:Uncharacterized protein n=1 Tax=Panicum hallii TaxID=206008 RepID=A0A2T8KUP0_9POAL|nr:hypothetical protein PAHAL_1G099000 [Panicum hallii]
MCGADLLLCLEFSGHSSFQDFSDIGRPAFEEHYHMQPRTYQISSPTPFVLHSTPYCMRWYTCTFPECT